MASKDHLTPKGDLRSLSKVLKTLESKAPLQAAEAWDNVGLLAGDPDLTVSKAVISIDLSVEAVELALQKKCNLIITHHPAIFPKGRGPNRVLSGTALYEAIRNEIAVAAYHTNFDRCALEVVEKVASGLGVHPKGRLIDESDSTPLVKLVTYVPLDHAEAVRKAVCEAGAGFIGNYDQATFASEGEGTFRGQADSKPFLGKAGELERCRELRLETVFPNGMQQSVLSALKVSHPYEEVAYDFIPVSQKPNGKGLIRGLGYGFWGEFPSSRAFSDVAENVTKLFHINGFWITNPVPNRISRIGFVAGKGSSFVNAALSQKCDLLITGETGYHSALAGARQGLSVMELGHRESEKFFLETMKQWLAEMGLESFEVSVPTQKIWIGDKK